ncbi:MAG TPA: hypothetical protein PLG90_07010 [Ignavibacteria bacterium]|nr:hypothetical protein [Ignavibacteria bacterium]
MMNLKNNLKNVNLIKRRSVIESFLSELVFNATVFELKYSFNKNNIKIICNGKLFEFKINTPINFLKNELLKSISNNTYKSQFYLSHIPENPIYALKLAS